LKIIEPPSAIRLALDWEDYRLAKLWQSCSSFSTIATGQTLIGCQALGAYPAIGRRCLSGGQRQRPFLPGL